MKKNIFNFKVLKDNYLIYLTYIFSFTLTLFVHNFNLFNYPYFENDEGTYISQAWSIETKNQLSPYTYWYDHAPFGWIMIYGFAKLVGGFYTFGSAIETGRVFISILFFIVTIFIAKITHSITKNHFVSMVAIVATSLLPLGTYFQRRVLLDNLMVFWFVISLYLVINPKLKIRNTIFSGIVLGLAVLSKESAIFFAPGIIYLVYTGLEKKQKLIGLFMWLSFFVSTVFLYICLALFKTELFPNDKKVSLIGTLIYHSKRGEKLFFWQKGSDFYRTVFDWINRDLYSPFIMLFVVLIGSIIYFFNNHYKNRAWTGILILLFSYILFIIRGGLLLEFYVIPLVPLIGLLLGLIVNYFIELSKNRNIVLYKINRVVLPTLTIIAFVFLQFFINTKALTFNDNKPLNKMLSYIRTNLDSNSKILIDNSIALELWDSRDKKEKVFHNAHYYWKADTDPDVRESLLKNDINNIDYIFSTFQHQHDMNNGSIPFNREAFYNSKKIKDFSENGIISSLYRVANNKVELMKNTWFDFKTKNINNGQVTDKLSNKTTSEGQSLGLLRSLWADDMDEFNKIWNYTQNNLQIRKDDKLLISQIEQLKTKEETENLPNSTDGDLDTALALILSSKKLMNSKPELALKYKNDALELVNSIWSKRVVKLNNQYVLLPFESTKKENYEIINPAFFSPAHYKIFSEFDKTNNWQELYIDSYKVLNELTKINPILPNWAKFNYLTSKYESANGLKGDNDADDYGYYAQRIFWRVGLDYSWNKSNESLSYMKSKLEFFEKEFKTKNSIKSSYKPDGSVGENFESTASDGSVLVIFDSTKSPLYNQFLHDKFVERIDLDFTKFDSKNNFNNQNWGWFVFAKQSGLVQKDF
jgi:endo-1,4-beta-D-glucanase Y